MQRYKLRPHHLLCISFFEGKGYSSDFTANMAEVIAGLENTEPLVEIISGADCICRSCPNNANGACLTAEKVSRYDKAVSALCSISNGDVLPWTELKRRAQSEIISAGKLPEVCGNCKWYCICKKAGT